MRYFYITIYILQYKSIKCNKKMQVMQTFFSSFNIPQENDFPTGMPSNSYSDLTLGSSGNSYTANKNGFLYLAKMCNGSDQYITMYQVVQGQSTAILGDTNPQHLNGSQARCYMPVKKGNEIGINYTAGGATNRFCLVESQGQRCIIKY